jgi:hypothetical protein
MSHYPTTYGNVAISVSPSTGQYLYSNGSNTNWTVNTNSTFSQNVRITGKEILLDEDADIKFGDASLMETLREIQSQLAILTPDPQLESEFKELKDCAREYERLRTKFLEQKQMWDTLKQQSFDCK